MLKQHPQIAMPRAKELHYFNTHDGEDQQRINPNHANSLAWYHGRFFSWEPGQVAGEFSTSYLKHPDTATAIYQYNPAIKLVAILRHPVDRARSHHQFLYSRGMRIPSDFDRALQEWPTLIKHGQYARQLKPYFALFPPEQRLILSFDEMVTAPEQLLQRLYHFLGVEEQVPEGLHERANASQAVRNARWHEVISRVHRSLERAPFVKRVMRKVGLLDFFVRQYDRNLQKKAPEESDPAHSPLRVHFEAGLEELKALVPHTFDAW